MKYGTKALPPVTATKTESGCTVVPWNREYKLSSAPFLSSIVSSGEELLSAPIRLIGTENGKDFSVTNFTSELTYGVNSEGVSACQYGQSRSFVFNTTLSAEDDGMMDWFLTVSSKGRSVAQVFGLQSEDDDGRVLSRLWLEIPIKRKFASGYHYSPQRRVLLDGQVPPYTMPLYAAGAMPEKSLELPFVHQLFVGGDEVGFALFFESDQNWQCLDPQKNIECEISGDEVIIRVRLLDSEPRLWLDKGSSGGLDLRPISFRIGMQVTPVKPYPVNPYEERNVHIDCFKKILEPYEEFLFKPYEGDSDTVLERLKRMGVNVLYIHEKWNDIQNSPFLTESSAARLKKIVDEAHALGMKVVPYFGYELSTMSPYYGEKSDEYLSSHVHWHWYRFPYQRALRVCYNSDWQDIFVDGVMKLYDEFGFDGLYLDSVNTSEPCSNQKHGCGYLDLDGKLHDTYPVFAVRKMMKRLCAMVEERGGKICLHSGSTFPVATIAYAHMLWEGEPVQAEFLKGALSRVPEGYYRAVYSGRNLGVPINMLCYSNPPAWTYEEATSNALFLGIIPKPVDVGEPLEQTSKLWKILDGFDFNSAKWNHAYTGKITVSSDAVRVGFYENESEMLLFASNMEKREMIECITLECEVKAIEDAYTGDKISGNKDFSLEFKSFGHRIIRVKK